MKRYNSETNMHKITIENHPGGRYRHPSAFFGIVMLILGMLLSTSAAFAQSAQPNELTDIDFSSMPGERVQIIFTMSGEATKPMSFTINDPARIALDFANTANKLQKRNLAVGIGQAKSINSVEARGRTRVVLNLSQLVNYETQVKGNQVIITLGDSAIASASTTDMQPASSGASATNQMQSIHNVDFRRGKKGEGRVIITLSDPSTPINLREEGGKVVLDFINSNLPQALERRLDVTDFATPVTTIDTISQGGNVRMTIDATGEYEHLAYQSDETYTIEFKPLTPQQKEVEKRKKFGYTGERLSLNFQNIEIRAMLQLLADFTGLNMVVSDSVSGSVTLRLKNVPWDQALDIILKTKGLAQRQTGNVMLVAPSEEIAAREKLELESQKQLEDLAPLQTEWFQINYANANDLMGLFKKDKSMLSPRGTAVVDTRTNTLMIQETATNLDELRKLIKRLDIPVRQVLIESRIVTANNDFTKDLGVKFGVSKTSDFSTGSSNSDHVAYLGASAITGTAASLSTNNLIVDLGVSKAGAGRIGLAVGRIGNHLLQLELSALQAEGRGEVISSPRVITANQKKALIKQGYEVPYQEATSSGATSVSFKEAVLSLEVTPQITPDDRVIMDLKVSQDTADFSNLVLGTPPINTREVTTQVLVDNGETVVLGGVYEQTSTHNVNRIPFFGDLPVLGHLFRNQTTTDDKQELLIFVTPKILKDSLKASIQ